MSATEAYDARVRPSLKLPMRVKLVFGCGQAVESAVSFVANTFLLFFLTDVCGIAASVAGTIIFMSLGIDAVVDPAIGALSDRWRSRWGRRLPFMVASLPPLVIASVAIFLVPRSLGSIGVVVYALLFNICLRIGTSLYALPYSALTAELTDDYAERSSIAVYRCIFAFIGSVLCIAPAFGLIFAAPGALSVPTHYGELGVLLAGVVLAFGSICIVGLRGIATALPADRIASQSASRPFWVDVGDLARNKSFLLLFSGCLIVLVAAGSLNALNLYAYKYYWKLTPSQIQTPALVLQAGLLVGIPLTAFLLKSFEKRAVLSGSLLVLSIFQMTPPLVIYAANGAVGAQLSKMMLLTVSFAFGVSSSLVFIAFQSMLGDAVDEHELKFFTRCEGLYYSAIVFAGKAAVGVGSLIAGFMVSFVGLQAGHGKNVAALSDASRTALGMLWGPGHALFFLSSVFLLAFYKLNRREHASIVRSLKSRRS